MGAAESRDYLRDYLPTSNLLTKRVPLLAVSAWNCRCLHSILLTSLHAHPVATTPATTFVTTPVTTPVTTFVTTPVTVPYRPANHFDHTPPEWVYPSEHRCSASVCHIDYIG